MEQAKADVTLSLAVVTYARHAYSGRVDPASISLNFGYTEHLPDSVAVLADIASATDPAAGDVVTYNMDDLPQGATFDTSTGAFSWKPTRRPVGGVR